MSRRRIRSLLAALASVLLLPTLAGTALAHEGHPHPAPGGGPAPAAEPAPTDGVDLSTADASWATGTDFVVTGRGDGEGYHLSIGLEREKYAFRPLATIQPAGYDGDDWLGYQCVTGDRKHVVVSVLPRWAVNRLNLRDRGALVYTVDVKTGAVRPVAQGIAFKSHAVGCGTGAEAGLLRHLGRDQERTELLTLDTARGAVRPLGTVTGQLTNPVPTGDGKLLALRGNTVVRLAPGATQPERVATAQGEPYRLTAAAGGTADVMVLRDKQVDVARVTGGRLERWAGGTAGQVQLLPAAAGRNVVVGATADTAARSSLGNRAAKQPVLTPPAAAGGKAQQRSLPADTVSVEGRVLVATTTTRPAPDARPNAKAESDTADTLAPTKRLFLAATGQLLTGDAPRGRAAKVTHATMADPTGRARAADVTAAQFTTPTCGVPRNDPRRTAYGANHTQVTWAVEMASRKALSGPRARPANYLQSGLPAYSPSSDFGYATIKPNGGTVPPAIMNGILSQESAYKHASRRTLPGSAGNSVIGDYYGSDYGIDKIDYDNADCGYGIAQVTTGMRVSETSITPNGKAKIAIDYAENIQAGMSILVQKWNQLYDANIRFNNSDPSLVENWYTALWAYNSGIQPDHRFGNTTGCTPSPSCTDEFGNWGLGWSNNPRNPDYIADRNVFLRETYADAEHPSDWAYQERVLGWAETPIRTPQGDIAYNSAVRGPHQTSSYPITYPDRKTFCNNTNSCDANASTGQGCTRSDFRCWWHVSVNPISDCAQTCARSPFIWPADSTEPSAPNPWGPECNSDLGPNAIIVDELPDPSANIFCGSRNWNTSGSFTYEVGKNAEGAPIGIIDFHQVSTGFGAHTWFAGNRVATDTAHRVTGTWTPPALTARPYVIKAHIPRAGASVESAVYKITTADGTVRQKVINQHEHYNHWKSLGVYQLGPNAKVELSNVTTQNTEGGQGTVAWDALAFIPAPGTYVEHKVDAVAYFDEDQNVDGSSQLFWMKTPFRNRQELYDWAMRITGDVVGLPTCAGGVATKSCVMPATKAAMQRWRDEVVAAGTDPVNHPDGKSIAAWLGFSNPVGNRPTSSAKPAAFDTDDRAYKIRANVLISYVKGSDGKIVEGSADATYSHRTADTHLPTFVREALTALQTDYQINAPDLSYTEEDLHLHDHQTTRTNPNANGILPGRAYAFAGKRPVVTNDASSPVGAGGTCVAALYTAGGSIGYRPMLGAGYVSSAVQGWEQRTRAHPGVPEKVGNIAGEIYNAFFKGGLTGSPFNRAAPIWQELDFRACVDGTIRKVGGNPPLLRASHMPNQYLYHNGQAINLEGQPSGSAAPVMNGDFVAFTRLPDPNQSFPLWANQWGPCDTATGRSGNPWTMGADDGPAANPSRAHFCLDKNLPTDPDYS